MTGLNTNPLTPRVVLTNEKVTGPPAAEMLRRSGISSAAGDQLEILDNATGGGVLVLELLKLLKQISTGTSIKRVVAGDVDEKMLGYVGSKKSEGVAADLSWHCVEILQVDQQLIPLPDEAFSHVFSNFGIFFCKDDEAACKETLRVLKYGGTAGFTAWKAISWWADIAVPALSTFVPEAPALPSPGSLFPTQGWSDAIASAARLESAGFKDVRVGEYSFTPDVFPEEFAEATGGLVKVIANRIWSPDDNAKYAHRVEPALLRYLTENFPDGKWNGQMTALITLAKKL